MLLQRRGHLCACGAQDAETPTKTNNAAERRAPCWRRFRLCLFRIEMRFSTDTNFALSRLRSENISCGGAR